MSEGNMSLGGKNITTIENIKAIISINRYSDITIK